MQMSVTRNYTALALLATVLSACIPQTSTKFSITQRSDPLGDVQTLEGVCREMGLARMDAATTSELPKGTFVCESAPRGGHFIIFSPDGKNKQIDVFFAERSRSFSPEAKTAYSSLVRELTKVFGEGVSGASPTI